MRLWSKWLAGPVLAAGLLIAAPALAVGLDPAFPGTALGPAKAKGVVIWSHGRSINAEDSQSPTPAYLHSLGDNGWDVMRFNRLSQADTLHDSTASLIDYASDLKRQGYKQILLAGQSFGAFLSLMVADASTDIDAVIATAPAAYGSFDDFYDSFRLNASKLYPLLEQVKRARVMVFYFHGDDFDPGGRGERSREILQARGVGFSVVDQPAFLTGHWASSSGLFLRRYGGCIRDFADNQHLSGELVCSPRWGTMPSAELKLPPELADPPPRRQEAAAPTPPTGSEAPAAVPAPHGFRDVWYGFYSNGREVLLGIESVHGNELSAVYSIGPSIDDKFQSAWTRRKGKIVEDTFIFEEPGKSTLRFRPRPDRGLGATWISADGKTSMSAHLKQIDPLSLARRDGGKGSTPVTAAAAHGDSDEAQN